ncbi:hypothetical protein RND81_04G195100 [Saponaria officinalis]|uniref:Uncharacterized protein n=1 Tax=Saponaria officinalis TaxID=3572 RepID=A0AAW1LN16_SAPOF
MKIHHFHPSQSPSSSPSSSTTSSSLSTATTTAYTPRRRCIGLDLLVKAVYHVAGSVVGVPYIQRRVIRRRKPVIRFNHLLLTPTDDDHPQIEEQHDDHEIDCNCDVDNGELIIVGEIMKQRRRSKVVPLKYQDSVLQSLKPKDRRKRRSSKT